MNFKLILLILLCVGLASASNIVTLTYTGAGGNSNDGFYAYPYYVQVGSGTAVPMMCDDFADEIQVGEQWLAFGNALTQANAQNDFIFGNDTTFGAGNTTQATTGVGAYDEAGYIFTGMTSGAIDQSEGNAAVWYLFSPVSAAGIQGDTTARGILDQAYNFVSAHPSYDYSYITVYSPDPSDRNSPAYDPSSPQYDGHAYPQEFLAITGSSNPVPEPPPSLLLAVGGALIGLVGVVRRRRLSRA